MNDFETKLQNLLAEHPEVKSVTFDITKTITFGLIGIIQQPNESAPKQKVEPDDMILAMERGIAKKIKNMSPVNME